jgi:hypothetical protein
MRCRPFSAVLCMRFRRIWSQLNEIRFTFAQRIYGHENPAMIPLSVLALSTILIETKLVGQRKVLEVTGASNKSLDCGRCRW